MNIKLSLHIIAIMLLAFNTESMAQTEKLLSFTNAYSLINPAYNSFTPDLSVSYHSKYFKMDFDGAPRSNSIVLKKGIIHNNKVGFGASIDNLVYGYSRTAHTMFAFLYSLKTNRKIKATFAFQSGFSRKYYDYSSASITSNLNDPVFITGIQRFKLNFGYGFYLKGKNFFAGYSMPILFNYDNSYQIKFRDFYPEFKNTYHYLYFGISKDLSDFTLQPLLTTTLSRSQKTIFGLGCKLGISEKLKITAIYSNNRVLSFSLNYDIIKNKDNIALSSGFSYSSMAWQYASIMNSVYELKICITFKKILDRMN